MQIIVLLVELIRNFAIKHSFTENFYFVEPEVFHSEHPNELMLSPRQRSHRFAPGSQMLAPTDAGCSAQVTRTLGALCPGIWAIPLLGNKAFGSCPQPHIIDRNIVFTKLTQSHELFTHCNFLKKNWFWLSPFFSPKWNFL